MLTGSRIAVVGTAGAGKTMLAQHIARRLSIPHIELDALHWNPHWIEAPLNVFRQRTQAALEGDAWVVDGNYSKVRDITWGRATTIVWLDYPLHVIMWQLLRRTIRRSLTREELWNGNRENMLTSFLRGDSILLWALQTHNKKRREYSLLFQKPEYARLTLVHLCTRGDMQRWLERLPDVTAPAKTASSPQ